MAGDDNLNHPVSPSEDAWSDDFGYTQEKQRYVHWEAVIHKIQTGEMESCNRRFDIPCRSRVPISFMSYISSFYVIEGFDGSA